MDDAAVGVAALFVADDRHRLPSETAQTANNGAVLGKGAVAGQRREIGDQGVDIVARMGPVGVAGDLHALPRREFAVGLAQHALGLSLQLADLIGNVELLAIGEVAQLFDLAFQLGDRFFKVEKVAHGALSNGRTPRGQAGGAR